MLYSTRDERSTEQYSLPYTLEIDSYESIFFLVYPNKIVLYNYYSLLRLSYLAFLTRCELLKVVMFTEFVSLSTQTFALGSSFCCALTHQPVTSCLPTQPLRMINHPQAESMQFKLVLA